MSKEKRREIVLVGTTKPLVDGIARQITLVGVVTESVTADTKITEGESFGKNSYTTTKTIEFFDKYEASLSIGLSIQNPIDEYNEKEGLLRARGRALKPDKALVTLNTTQKFFYDDVVQSILDQQLLRVINNPNKFIKVSAKKEPLKSALEPLVIEGPVHAHSFIQVAPIAKTTTHKTTKK